jgi:hypothetical protein
MDNTVHKPNIEVKSKVRILFGSIELLLESAGTVDPRGLAQQMAHQRRSCCGNAKFAEQYSERLRIKSAWKTCRSGIATTRENRTVRALKAQRAESIHAPT